ncbi:MAG: hypothetical protein EGR77_01725 [Pseudobutyrivibrio sp.]|nr:hypothetical protein [Pseudobutyrivibrio sp.]
MADNPEELDGLGKELLDVMDRLQSAWSARLTALAEKEMQLQTVQNELDERAQNVVRMEKSIREHMKQKTDLEERLSSASSKQNTAFLKMQIMEGEKANAEKTLADTEQRLQEALSKITELEAQNAELQLTNQKLTAEKMKLLKLQISGGNEI